MKHHPGNVLASSLWLTINLVAVERGLQPAASKEGLLGEVSQVVLRISAG